MKPDDDFDKQIDLDGSEFRKSDEPEPFWGYNAKHTLILFIVGMVLTAILSRIIYGSFPYWLQPLLE